MAARSHDADQAAAQDLRAGTQSLDRAIGLLKLVASAGASGLRLVDLVRMSSLQRPTVSRMANALVRQGLLARLRGSSHYILGEYCGELNAGLGSPSDLRAVCDSVLRGISEQTGNSSFLFVPAELDTLCVSRRMGSYPIQVLAIRVGHRQPIGVGAGGVAMLSVLPLDERERIIRANETRLSGYGNLSVPILRTILRSTWERGYALIGHYSVPGVIGVGIPLRNGKAEVIGAITTASIDSRMTRSATNFAVQCAQQHLKKVQHRLNLVQPMTSRFGVFE
jgi:DNA-binding IclR family transcriptional regulator